MNLSSIIRRPALCRETSAPDNSLATSILPVPRSDSRGHLICCLARARQSSAQQSSHGETALFQTPVVRQDVDGRSAPGAAGALSPLVAGKRFVCTECGKCCQGVGEVWANQSEITAIARHLGLSERHFKRKFTKSYSRRPGWFMLQRQQGSGDCVFLKDGTKCTIYGARPLQCSSYPWWPWLMNDESWRAERQDVCEGIEHEDAEDLDVVAAATQLSVASQYFADFDAAAVARGGRTKGNP